MCGIYNERTATDWQCLCEFNASLIVAPAPGQIGQNGRPMFVVSPWPAERGAGISSSSCRIISNFNIDVRNGPNFFSFASVDNCMLLLTASQGCQTIKLFMDVPDILGRLLKVSQAFYDPWGCHSHICCRFVVFESHALSFAIWKLCLKFCQKFEHSNCVKIFQTFGNSN